MSAPHVSAATIEAIRQQRFQMERDPEGSRPPAELHRAERFIFRTHPGTVRALTHNLDVPPEGGEGGTDKELARFKFATRRWEQRMAKRFPKAKPDEKPEQTVARARRFYEQITSLEHLDGAIVSFQRVPKRQECFYATDDPMVADYLRGLVKAKIGEFAHVYEQNGRARIVVGDTAFPDTPGGRQMAFAYAAEQNIAELRMVDGDDGDAAEPEAS